LRLQQFDYDISPPIVTHVDGFVNGVLSLEAPKMDLPVSHLARLALRSFGVHALEVTASDRDEEVVVFVPMHTGGLSGGEREIPHPDTIVLEQQFRSDLIAYVCHTSLL
tara:strand:- start:1512 stop:1838 length:327 start_codon:yes stop_codon:yes gene_type:complete